MRWTTKYLYYRDYRRNAPTDMRRMEIRSKYRPLTFIALGIEIAGCALTAASIFISS